MLSTLWLGYESNGLNNLGLLRRWWLQNLILQGVLLNMTGREQK